MSASDELADNEYLFTSESVTEGHPDKICDQISDGVLDAVLAEDPNGRVACETLVNTGLVVVSGEISTDVYVDIPKIVRRTINEIGYDNGEFGFDGNSCAVIIAIDEQSAGHRPGRRRGATRPAPTPATRTSSTSTVPATRG